MIAKTESEISMIMHHDELVMFYREGTLSDLYKLASRGIAVKIKTSFPRASELFDPAKKKKAIKLEIVDAPQSLNCMICDDREMIILLNKTSTTKRQETKTFYTNSKFMISAFKVVLDKF
jgi:hypothetical protein